MMCRAWRRSRWRIPLPAAIAALLVLCAGVVGLRKEIVRHAPQLASFYSAMGMPVNLRGHTGAICRPVIVLGSPSAPR